MLITVEEACRLIKAGNVVAVPTDTVYGFAALATDLDAIDRLYALKQRPPTNPLTIHIGNKQNLFSFVDEFPEDFDRLTNAFWPGALTVVIPVDPRRVLEAVRAGLNTTGFRLPNHQATLELLRIAGPLVIPSANLSGKPPATSSAQIEANFGTDFPILNGSVGQGVPSTVLDFHQEKWRVIRQGAISPNSFRQVLGYVPPTHC